MIAGTDHLATIGAHPVVQDHLGGRVRVAVAVEVHGTAAPVPKVLLRRVRLIQSEALRQELL